MRRRGQLVLLAAVLLAVALLPLLTAVVQLGYQPSGPGRAVDSHPVTASSQVLERAVADVAPRVPRNFSWGAREAAAAAVRRQLAPTAAALNRSRIASGTSLAVVFNESRAARWAGLHCPGGPGREFGDCWTSGGVVLQERRGRAHLVAVATDVSAVGRDAVWDATLVLRARA